MEQYLNFFENQKVMITGGGGYLGSKLAEKLAVSKASIFICDIKFNEISNRLINNGDHVSKLKCDLTNKKDINQVCKKLNPDYIYHFAALLNRERDFSLYPLLYKVNVESTFNLLESLKTTEYKGFFFSSTSEVYGAKNNSPFSEEQLPDPVSPYSLTKFMAEQLISTYSEVYNKPYTIMRLFNFYGPEMPERFFISQLESTLKRNDFFEMTEGKQVRDFLHINDLIEKILIVSSCSKAKNHVLNICSGYGRKLIDIAFEKADELDKRHLLKPGALPYRKNEIWEMIGDNKKLLSLL